MHSSLSELKQYDHWVVWRTVPRKNGKKPEKVPYNPERPFKAASPTDPRTWATYEVASAIASTVTGIDGIGFVFTEDDPYVGVDLDDCVRSGKINPSAEEVVNRLGTYTEVSPSGCGMHAIGRAELDSPRNRTTHTAWQGSFEVYDRARYFTVTGEGFGAIQTCQETLDALILEMFGGPPRFEQCTGGQRTRRAADDDWLKAAQALGGWSEREAEWFTALLDVQIAFIGNQPSQGHAFGRYPSRSEAEAAIVYRLVSNGASDRQIVEFADRHLPKHIERRRKGDGRYMQTTIDAARAYLYGHERRISSPKGGWPKKRDGRYRKTTEEQHAAAVELAKGQEQAEWLRQVQDLGISRATAYRVRAGLIAEGRLHLETKAKKKKKKKIFLSATPPCR